MELNSKVELTDIAKKFLEERLTNVLFINYILFFIVINWKFFLVLFSSIEIEKKIYKIEELHSICFYLVPLFWAIILGIVILPLFNIAVTWYTEKMKVIAVNVKKRQNLLILEEVSFTSIIKKRNDELESEIYKSSLLKNKAYEAVRTFISDLLQIKKDQVKLDINSEGIENNSFVFYNTSDDKYNYLDGVSFGNFERGQMKDYYFVYYRDGNFRILIKSEDGVIKFKLNNEKIISPDNLKGINGLIQVEQNEYFESKWTKL